MTQKIFVVEGRQFRTESDYNCARRDKEIIDRLRAGTDFEDREALQKLAGELRAGKYKFGTLLGQDFRDEVEALLKKAGRTGQKKEKKKRGLGAVRRAERGADKAADNAGHRPGQPAVSEKDNKVMAEIVARELRKREKRRKLILLACSAAAVCCLGYFGVYAWHSYRTDNTYQALSALKEKPVVQRYPSASQSGPQFTLDEAQEPREVAQSYVE